jgi:membrane protein DedA with SNARE-associated domain
MTLSEQIFNLVTSLMEKSGYAGIFVLMVLESATVPIPSELILPFAGYLVFLGQLNFWLAVVVASVGSIVGTMIDYFIGYSLGRAAILRYGRFVRLEESRLETAERWFARHGSIVVLLARFVPLIRTLIAFPAGIAEMKIWKFVLFSSIGIVIWDTALIYVGFVAGQKSSQIISALSAAFTPIEIVAVIVAGLFVVFLLMRRSRRPTSGVERGAGSMMV